MSWAAPSAAAGGRLSRRAASHHRASCAPAARVPVGHLENNLIARKRTAGGGDGARTKTAVALAAPSSSQRRRGVVAATSLSTSRDDAISGGASDDDSAAATLAAVELDTRAWLERVVMGLNLCPFARAALPGTRVHVTTATDLDDLRVDVARELAALGAANPGVPATTLVVLPPGALTALGADTFAGQGLTPAPVHHFLSSQLPPLCRFCTCHRSSYPSNIQTHSKVLKLSCPEEDHCKALPPGSWMWRWRWRRRRRRRRWSPRRTPCTCWWARAG